MAYLDKYSFDGMPSFRDPNDGHVWAWDASSKTYVKKEKVDEAPRGSQTGGDNRLFDPFKHTEMTDVPELAGHMAASWNMKGVLCPNCQNMTEHRQCETCGKELTPEWTKKQQKEDSDAFLHQTQNSPPNEFHSDPEREPKRNRMKTDDSYPSMLSKVAFDDWGLDSGPNQIGKWIVGIDGQLYADQNPDAMHQDLAMNNGFLDTAEYVIALGTVLDDGTAETLVAFHPDQFDLEQTEAELSQMFGPLVLTPPVSGNAQEAQAPQELAAPLTIQGGLWVVQTTKLIEGVAWVKERANGIPFDPSMILLAEHLQISDEKYYANGVKAIITAAGKSSTEHAVVVAKQKGWPAIVGIGEDYNKIQTGHHVMIDPSRKVITVSPERPGGQQLLDEAKEKDKVDNPWHYNDDRLQNLMRGEPTPGGHLAKPLFFAHVDEEIAWKLANEPNLTDCPECSAPMAEREGEKFCPACGHKQPIITTGAQKLAILPALALGAGARAMMGSGMMGKLMGSALGQRAIGSGIGRGMAMGVGMQAGPEVAGMIPGANMIPGLGPDQQQPQAPVAPGAMNQGLYAHFMYADTFGEEEVGTATKNRGEGSDPELDGSGADWEEKGDGPELLKDDENGGSTSPDQADQQAEQHGNPELEEMALKAFEINLPLILELAESEDSGADHPILQAIDSLLEEAFPGYKEIKEDIEEETGLDIDGDGEQGEPAEHVEEVEGAADEFGKEVEEDEPFDEFDNEEEEEDDDDLEDDLDFEKSANQMEQMGLVLDASGQIMGQFVSQNPDGTIKILTRNGYQDVDPSQVRIEKAANVKEGWSSGLPPQDMPMQQQQPPQSVGVGTCPLCGQNHQPGTPCPTAALQQPQAQPQVGMQPMVAPNTQPLVTTKVANDPGLWSKTAELSGWVTSDGRPLEEGGDYHLHSENYAVPDRITVEQVTPEKLTFVIHTGDVDYKDQISKTEMETYRYTFKPADTDMVDSTDSWEEQENPIQPGDDPLPQQTDLSNHTGSLEEYTGSFKGDSPDSRDWLNEGTGVEVDPELMAKLASKDFSPREQREFIDESGEARNLDKLELDGTHYIMDELDSAFNW